MRLEYARRLQRALIDQEHARDELIGATSDEQTIAGAIAFMAAIKTASVVAAQVAAPASDRSADAAAGGSNDHLEHRHAIVHENRSIPSVAQLIANGNGIPRARIWSRRSHSCDVGGCSTDFPCFVNA